MRCVPLRLDFAIERALCAWWILGDWEQALEDDGTTDAIDRAIGRSAADTAFVDAAAAALADTNERW